MHEEGYLSLRLVTGWYHMRRSLLESGRAMPQTTIVAHPVFAQLLEPERWWSWHGAPFLIIGEYDSTGGLAAAGTGCGVSAAAGARGRAPKIETGSAERPR